jgi:hypothetical protein
MHGSLAGLALIALVGCSGGAASSTGDPPHDTTSASSGSAGSGGQGGAGGSATTSSGTGGSDTGGATGTGGAPPWGPDQCPPPPAGVKVGYEVGDQLPDIVVKDCDGNDVSLGAFCGASAFWIFAAHGWCPLCQSVSGQQEALVDGYAGQNVAAVNIVVEDGVSQPPTANYCKVWRDNWGLEDAVPLYDPTGAVLAIWGGPGSSSLSAFVDEDRVIVSKLVHTADVSAIKAGIQGALDSP